MSESPMSCHPKHHRLDISTDRLHSEYMDMAVALFEGNIQFWVDLTCKPTGTHQILMVFKKDKAIFLVHFSSDLGTLGPSDRGLVSVAIDTPKRPRSPQRLLFEYVIRMELWGNYQKIRSMTTGRKHMLVKYSSACARNFLVQKAQRPGLANHRLPGKHRSPFSGCCCCCCSLEALR